LTQSIITTATAVYTEKCLVRRFTRSKQLNGYHMTGRRSDFCTNNGGRGIKSAKTGKSLVRGIWELHPVIGVTTVR
jgi:hypothetical protein